MKPLKVLSGKNLEEINAFLGELQDGDTYKKRLKALEDQKKEINGLIEVYGKASKIDGLVSDALRDKEQAQKILDKALEDRTSASEEIKEAKAAARKFIDDRRRAGDERLAARERALVEGEASLDEREEALSKARDDLVGREKKLAVDMEKAERIRTQYTEAVVSLKRAIEETSKAL